MDAQLVSRRGERRRSQFSFVAMERRTGFDRRDTPSARLLSSLRDNPAILFALLVAVNAMNVIDYLLTIGALRAGYAEGNPVMAHMFSQGMSAAALYKFGVVGAVSVVVWLERRYRLVLQAAILAIVAFGGVLLVHTYGFVFCY